jgi:hypothetical protein
MSSKFNEAEPNHKKDASFIPFTLSSSIAMHSHGGVNNSSNGGRERTRSKSLTSQTSIAYLPQEKPTRQNKGRVYTGWLWKRGDRLKRWKKRFFVLRGRVLTYYKDCCLIERNSSSKKSELYQYNTRERGAILLSSATFSSRTQFGIQITAINGKKMYLQAENEEFREQWLHAFVQATRIHPISEYIHVMERHETSSMYNFGSTCRAKR